MQYKKGGNSGRNYEQGHCNRDHPGAEVYNIIAGKNNERGKDLNYEKFKTLWHGCHICGTEETPNRYYLGYGGYAQCKKCSDRFQSNYGTWSFFDYLTRDYKDSIHDYYKFLLDEFYREQFRKIRIEEGKEEPMAFCKSCKKIKPLFDMQRADYNIKKFKIKNGIIHFEFCCFECVYDMNYKTLICRDCGKYFLVNKDYYHKRIISGGGLYDFCDSCMNIYRYEKQIKERNLLIWNEERKIRNEIEIVNRSARRWFLKHNVDEPSEEMLEMKVSQINHKKTLRQFKQWRKGISNEPNHTDVYGKQHANEINYERGVSA